MTAAMHGAGTWAGALEVDCFSLAYTVHEPMGSAMGATIFYLHGGGLLFGERDDLPRPWLAMLAGAGHRVVALDYPLAPETDVREILSVCERAIELLASAPELGCSEHGYVLFGRSAGAYLALQLAVRLRRRDGAAAPLGVMDFYGYPSLADSRMMGPSRHYGKLAPVDEAVALAHVGGRPTSGAVDERFLLYVYARQTGRWMELIGATTPEDRQACSLDEAAMAMLPPVFACASTGDKDVPFGASRALRQTAPDVTWIPVYEGEHDFDRDPSSAAAREVYARAVSWLAWLAASGAEVS